jgi:hypothetical protein
MRTSGGETFQRAQARQAGGRRGKQFFPEEKVSPERSFDSATLRDMATSQVFDSYSDGTTVTPFELDLDRVGMNDWVEFFDAYDGNLFDPKTAPVDPAKSNATTDKYEPAPISIAPTSTTNPERPRTVAAGYRVNPGPLQKGGARQSDLGTLTVIFRDGTLYNYYDVPVSLWQQFKVAVSKGKFILTYLDGSFEHGYANQVSQAPVHKAAMVAQKTLQSRPRKGRGPVQVTRQTRRKRVR